MRAAEHSTPESDPFVEAPHAAIGRRSRWETVRVVLGHWLIGYIHPYMDGNGRVARFLMNVMLASGGYPWTVIRLEDRARYLRALDRASLEQDIQPFAEAHRRARPGRSTGERLKSGAVGRSILHWHSASLFIPQPRA